MPDKPSDTPIPEAEEHDAPSSSEHHADDATLLPDLDVPIEADDRLGRMMAGSFLEYASYVIRDRAIPDVGDGLKPVQRRILHSLFKIDDGRFHKVANVIGQTMQYHPHGDASIGSALVVLANKEYFIERQGNFGNIYTGDEASAARYIECRLTPLAREVLFNPETTEFIDSYDGRNKEPVTLPAKIPVLIMLGAEGIAVGMSTRTLPHNFGEVLRAQIAVLRDEPFQLYPDFLQGGIMDVSEYDDGHGRIKLRARIEEVSDKVLAIREIPATTTTESLTASIEDVVKRGRMKLSGINDYTAEQVEIEIRLPRGIYAKEVIPQLDAYTTCEVSISSNILVIEDNMPVELSVTEVVQRSTEQLLRLLKLEQEIRLGKLEDRFHALTLAQLFIENRIYKRIEEKETYEEVLAEVHAGLAPFRDQLTRDITDEDIEKLLQLQIRRISRFDINRNRQELDKILEDMRETKHNLAHLTDFATAYLEDLIERYAGAFPRRTEVMALEEVDVKEVALQNIKVGHDRVNQFVGTDVRNSNRSEPPLACTEYDRLLLLRSDGVFRVINLPDKLYIGAVKYLFKYDKEQVFSMLYRHKKSGAHYAKRFQVERFITDREYKALPDGCIIVGLYTNHGVKLRLELKPSKRRQEDHVDLDFDEVVMRSATARGFKVTGYPVDNVSVLDRGASEAPELEEPQEPEDEQTEPETSEPPPASPSAPEASTAEDAPAAKETPPEPPPAAKRKRTKSTGKSAPPTEPPAPDADAEEGEAASAPPVAREDAKAKNKRPSRHTSAEDAGAVTDGKPADAPEPTADDEETPESKPNKRRARKSGEGAKKKPPEPSPRARRARKSGKSAEEKPEPKPEQGATEDVAAEWEKRSGRGRLHREPEPEPPAAEDDEAPTAAPDPEAESGTPAEDATDAKAPDSLASRIRKRIDEDTPFFLE
jgi:topoisomerase-4 subunit A